MENCSIKQGKFVIDNDAVEKLGCFKVVVPAGTCEFGLGLVNGTVVNCDNTTDTIKMTDSNGEVTLTFPYVAHDIATGNSRQRFTGTLTKKTIFEFSNLYNNRTVELFNSTPVDSITKKVLEIGISANSDFRAIRIDTNYQQKGYIVDLSVFEGKNTLASIMLQGGTAKGNISSFDRYLEYLTTVNLSGCTDVVGNISALRRCEKISTLNLWNTNVGGTLESFVEGQCELRNTTATVVVECTSSNVTFNEASVSKVNVNITATGASVTDYATSTLLGTYTKSGGSWSYPS